MSILGYKDSIDVLPREFSHRWKLLRSSFGDRPEDNSDDPTFRAMSELENVVRMWFENRGDPCPLFLAVGMLEEWYANGCPEPPPRNRPRCGSHDGCWEDLVVLDDGGFRCEACDITFGPSWGTDEKKRRWINLDGPHS